MLVFRFQKVIKRIKFYDQLHGHFGYPKPLKDDTMYAYVLRRYNAPVPLFECYKEAEAEMPGYFLVGTFNGRFPRCIYYTLKVCTMPLRYHFNWCISKFTSKWKRSLMNFTTFNILLIFRPWLCFHTNYTPFLMLSLTGKQLFCFFKKYRSLIINTNFVLTKRGKNEKMS